MFSNGDDKIAHDAWFIDVILSSVFVKFEDQNKYEHVSFGLTIILAKPLLTKSLQDMLQRFGFVRYIKIV